MKWAPVLRWDTNDMVLLGSMGNTVPTVPNRSANVSWYKNYKYVSSLSYVISG